jgi:hypothetical protein
MIYTFLWNAIVALEIVGPARFTGGFLTCTLGFPFTAATAGNIRSGGDLLLFHDHDELTRDSCLSTYNGLTDEIVVWTFVSSRLLSDRVAYVVLGMAKWPPYPHNDTKRNVITD